MDVTTQVSLDHVIYALKDGGDLYRELIADIAVSFTDQLKADGFDVSLKMRASAHKGAERFLEKLITEYGSERAS